MTRQSRCGQHSTSSSTGNDVKKPAITHTVRWNGDKTGRIITFTPRFMKKLKTARHDMVIRVILENTLTKLKSLTGITHVIDYDQQIELEELVKSITKMSNNYHLHLIEVWMVDGIKNSSRKDPEQLFDELNVIFPALYAMETIGLLEVTKHD